MWVLECVSVCLCVCVLVGICACVCLWVYVAVFVCVCHGCVCLWVWVDAGVCVHGCVLWGVVCVYNVSWVGGVKCVCGLGVGLGCVVCTCGCVWAWMRARAGFFRPWEGTLMRICVCSGETLRVWVCVLQGYLWARPSSSRTTPAWNCQSCSHHRDSCVLMRMALMAD